MQATALSKPMADQVQPNTKSMDDRVHQNTLPGSRNSQTTSSEISALKSQTMSSEKRDPFNPFPPPGTYVIHVPKDHIYQCPPPKNDQCYANYTRQKSRRSRSCCPYWLISILLTLIVFLGIAAGVFYLIFHPESPHYAIDQIYVKGMNLTSSSSTISPEFNLTIKANNDNDKIGIYYENDITVEIFYRDALLSNDMMPTFYQPSNNVTVFQTVLKGNNVELRRSDQRGLVNAVAKRIVPLSLKLRAPVKIKLGHIKTWKIRINVDCDVTVNQLTGHVKIVHKHCNNGLDLWL